MSKRTGLPDRTTRTAYTSVLDSLTEPDTSGAPGASGTEDTSVNLDTSGTEDVSGNSDTQGASETSGYRDNRDNRGTRGTRERASTSTPPARDHVKLRRDLANQMRDAVWFLAEHGRPRVQLGEILDEAIEAWLAETKKTLNDGDDFPHKGRLR